MSEISRDFDSTSITDKNHTVDTTSQPNEDKMYETTGTRKQNL